MQEGECTTHSECAPAIHQALGSERETAAVTSSELSDDCSRGELLGRDSFRRCLARIHASVAARVGAGIALVIVHLAQASIPSRVSAQSALVVDPPAQDLVVVGQGEAVHAASCDLHNTNFLSSQVRIETRSLDVDRFLLDAQAKLAGLARAADKYVQFLCGRVVDRGFDFLRGFDGFFGGFALTRRGCR